MHERLSPDEAEEELAAGGDLEVDDGKRTRPINGGGGAGGISSAGGGVADAAADTAIHSSAGSLVSVWCLSQAVNVGTAQEADPSLRQQVHSVRHVCLPAPAAQICRSRGGDTVGSRVRGTAACTGFAADTGLGSLQVGGRCVFTGVDTVSVNRGDR